MTVKTFQEEYWGKFDQVMVFRHKAAITLIKEASVLDLGCGDGLFLQMLKQKAVKGVGLEISQIAVDKAKAKDLDARKFDFGDADLPFDNKSFDIVVLLDVLEHLYQPDKTLQESYRVCSQGIVLSVPNSNSLPSRLQMLLGKIPENNKHKQGHIYWISYSIIKDLLKRNGFKISEMKVNSFFSWLPLVKNITQFLAEKWPSLFALNFVIKAKKLGN